MSGFHLLEPDFRYCHKDQLGKGLVWLLEEGYHVPLDEFVALPHDGGIILLNNEYPNIRRIRQIFTEYCTIDDFRHNKKLDSLYDEFKKLTSDSNTWVLIRMRSLYQERRKEARIKAQAQETVKQFRKNRITTKRNGKEDIIHAIFSIGWDKKTVQGGSALGAEYCFLYGYLSAITEKQRNANIQDKNIKEKHEHIYKLVSSIDDFWVLDQIQRFIVNITK